MRWLNGSTPDCNAALPGSNLALPGWVPPKAPERRGLASEGQQRYTVLEVQEITKNMQEKMRVI
jgi:hypothetical protein